MNAKAAAIHAQLTVGSVITIPGRADLGQFEVAELREKSVYFTNGKYENNRSLFHYVIVR